MAKQSTITTPTPEPDVKALATEASAYMQNDKVSAANVRAWLPLFAPEHPVAARLATIPRAQLSRYAQGPKQGERIPRTLRAELKPAYRKCGSQHEWLKGIIAAYLAVEARSRKAEAAAKRAERKAAKAA